MDRVQRQRLFMALLAFTLLVPFTHAAYSVEVTPINNEILRDEVATFNVSISSFQSTGSRFQAYTVDPAWNLKTDPITPVVPAGGQITFLLIARPTGDAPTGAQGISVTFKDLETGSLIKKNLVLNLRSGDFVFGQYLPAVALNVIMPYEVDPRSPVPLRLEVRNRNQLNISDLQVEVRSPHFSYDGVLQLPPLSERTRDVPGVRIDPLTPPEEAELQIRLIVNGEVINQLEKNYKVQEYTTIRQHVDERTFFFKKTKEITVTNDGNVGNSAIVSVPTSAMKALFVSSPVAHERTVYEGENVMLWTIPLAPNETRTFAYVENYRILVLLLLIAGIAGIAYLLLRSPVVVMKEAVGVAKQDGVSRIKVRIFVKNRSAKLVRDLHITDRVPSLADVIKAESPGSITPSKIAVSEKKGTLLRWNLDVLEPYEERILTYHAKSKLKIIGRMSLPNAKTKFTAGGKERVVFSNNIELVERFKDK